MLIVTPNVKEGISVVAERTTGRGLLLSSLLGNSSVEESSFSLADLPLVEVDELERAQMEQCLGARRQLLQDFLSFDDNTIQGVWARYEKVVQTVLELRISMIPPNAEDKRIIAALRERLNTTNFCVAPQWLQLASLYLTPADIVPPERLLNLSFPQTEMFFKWAVAMPTYVFIELGSIERHAQWIAELMNRVAALPNGANNTKIKHLVLMNFRSMALYHAKTIRIVDVLRDLSSIEQAISPTFPVPKIDPSVTDSRSKKHVGVVLEQLNQSTESRAVLPYCLEQRQNGCTVTVYAKQSSPVLQQWVEHHIGPVVILPERLWNAVAIMANEKLDVLHYASNLTWGASYLRRLASHRLAPVQQVHFAQPTSTGLSTIDRFVVGEFMDVGGEMLEESACVRAGSGITFAFFDSGMPPVVSKDTDETIRFISGANLNKITPETIAVWIEVLKRVPNSELYLYPFGPAWQRSYPKQATQLRLEAFASEGEVRDRIFLCDSFEDQSHIPQALSYFDVYLDAWPYSGATSLLDPLSVGLPTIVGRSSGIRFSQGSALLEEVGLGAFVADSVEEFIDIAVRILDPVNLKRQKQLTREKFSEWRNRMPSVVLG